MSAYSVTDAKSNLAELIDRALAGEGVVITRQGRPVVELKPVAVEPRQVTEADIEWMAANLVSIGMTGTSSIDAVSCMRDEDWT